MRDVVILDASVLAAPWTHGEQWMTEILALKRERALAVSLTPASVRLPRRMTEGENLANFVDEVGWRAWTRVLPLIRAQDRHGMLDDRLKYVGPWLEEHALRSGEPVRVVVVSVESPDELLEVVTFCAEQRAAGRPTGVRHLLWDIGRPVEGLAAAALLHLERAGGDL